MSLKVGIDFGTSNSGVAVYDGQRVRCCLSTRKMFCPKSSRPCCISRAITAVSIGQEAVENYYRDNVNRQRRFVKQWAGEIDVYGADMHYVRDIFVYVDELKPGRLLQYLKTALRKDNYRARRSSSVITRRRPGKDLSESAESNALKMCLGEPIDAVTLGAR
jgi:hypothetical protein